MRHRTKPTGRAVRAHDMEDHASIMKMAMSAPGCPCQKGLRAKPGLGWQLASGTCSPHCLKLAHRDLT